MASPASWAAVMERAAARLAALGFTPSAEFDLAAFIEQVQAHCGRPIVLVQRSSPVCGFTFPGPDGALYVCYAATTSPLQRIHNVVHECAHILLEHKAAPPLWAPQVGDGGSDADDRLEAGWSEYAEREAEAAAAVLLGRWREPPAHQWAAMTALREGAARTTAALGWPDETAVVATRSARPAVALVVALVVAVVTSASSVAGRLSAVLPDLALGVVVPALSIAAAGTAAFALARTVSLHPWLLRWSTPTVGVVVALAQLIVWWAGQHGDGGAGVVLAGLSLLWPAATLVLLLVCAARYRTLIPAETTAALALLRVGLGTATAALGVEAVSVVSTGGAGSLHDGAVWVLAIAVICVGVGVVLPHVSGSLTPVVHWVHAQRAYRELDWLYLQVLRYVPQWAPRMAISSSTVAGRRAAETRLYWRVIAIRDMCTVLLAGIDEHQAAAAVAFAKAHATPPTRQDIAAAAEACALSEAISVHLVTGGAEVELQHSITTPGELDPASLTEEAASLIRMAKVWRSWRSRGLIQRYLAATTPPTGALTWWPRDSQAS